MYSAQALTTRPPFMNKVYSIIEEQVNKLNDLGLPSVHLRENDAICLKAISDGKFRFIFCSAERCLSEKFKNLLKAEQTRQDIEIPGKAMTDQNLTGCQDKGNNWPRCRSRLLDLK